MTEKAWQYLIMSKKHFLINNMSQLCSNFILLCLFITTMFNNRQIISIKVAQHCVVSAAKMRSFDAFLKSYDSKSNFLFVCFWQNKLIEDITAGSETNGNAFFFFFYHFIILTINIAMRKYLFILAYLTLATR